MCSAGCPEQGCLLQPQTEEKQEKPWAGTALSTKLAPACLPGEGLGWAGVLAETPPTPKIRPPVLPLISVAIAVL